MKKKWLMLLLVLFCVKISAQDTIFMKSGERIPAIIDSKNETEIKYRKFPVQSAAIYSVFINDVSYIRYSNGIIDDFSTNNVFREKKQRPIDQAGNYGINKIGIVGNIGYLMRSDDNLDEFWEAQPGNPALTGNSVCYHIGFRGSALTSQSKRHWVSSGGDFFMAPRAIYSRDNEGLNEISIRMSSYNINLAYSYAFNTKKNLLVTFEPGFNFLFTEGIIKLNNFETELSPPFGTGWNFACGLDWFFSNRFHANFRIGQRISKSFTEKHFDENSPTWYSTYYINGDPVTIKPGGFYATIGLTTSMYLIWGTGRPE